jgi:hypothetical protein
MKYGLLLQVIEVSPIEKFVSFVVSTKSWIILCLGLPFLLLNISILINNPRKKPDERVTIMTMISAFFVIAFFLLSLPSGYKFYAWLYLLIDPCLIAIVDKFQRSSRSVG